MFRSGHAAIAVQALGEINEQGIISEYSADTLRCEYWEVWTPSQIIIYLFHLNRWMKRYFSDFEKDPDLMEYATIMDPMSPFSVSYKYVEAARRLGGLPSRLAIGCLHFRGWPMDLAIMKVNGFGICFECMV